MASPRADELEIVVDGTCRVIGPDGRELDGAETIAVAMKVFRRGVILRLAEQAGVSVPEVIESGLIKEVGDFDVEVAREDQHR